jgi:hypothetical protein
MKIKNKYELSFHELVTATKERGGVPDQMVVSIYEAMGIIKEIGRSDETSFVINFKGPYEIRKRNMILQGTLSSDDFKSLLNEWYKGEFLVAFDGIPVVIERQYKTKQNQPDTPFPE